MSSNSRTFPPPRVFFVRFCLFTLLFFLILGGVKFGARYYSRWKVSSEHLPAGIEALKALHQQLTDVRGGDWLDKHVEFGQTVAAFKAAQRPADKSKIVVQPLGGFDAQMQELAEITAKYLGLHFCLPVELRPAVPVDPLPPHAGRKLPGGTNQLLSGYLNSDVLAPLKPEDALFILGIAADDLWPGEGWNFVFGQASPEFHSGVFSLRRFVDADRKTVLRRVLQTAAHEAGHIIGLRHCTGYECLMNGSNSLEEADRHPMHLCPSCLAKLVSAAGCEPLARFRALEEFFAGNGLPEEADFHRQSAELLSRVLPAGSRPG